jgi:hypothetical protein
VVQPAYAQAGVDIARELGRGNAGDHRVGDQVGECEIDRAAGGDVLKHAILPDPVEVAGPVALPAVTGARDDPQILWYFIFFLLFFFRSASEKRTTDEMGSTMLPQAK